MVEAGRGSRIPNASDGAKIAYRALGGIGPDAVLIHGFGSDRMSWSANQPGLEAVANLWSLDLPGHGDSGMDVGDGHVATLATRVAALLDQHDIRKAHLIGHSLGGAIALVLADKRPDLVGSLALIAPAGLGQGIDPLFLSTFPDLAAPEETEALLRRLVVRPRLIGKSLVARVLAQLEKPGSREALRLIGAGLANRDPALEAAVASVSAGAIPRLVLWGEQDAINRLSQEKLRAFGGELALVAGAGHLPQIENPRLVNASIVNFLTRVCALDRAN
jgi:pyruvate dehydrogenase E2 component (dihydrolipoamide acetyltransferase)